MTIFKTIDEKKASGKVKKVFDSIKKERKIKKIPNFWKTIANDPETLERTWTSLKEIMKKGSLDPLTKEMIYIAVSMTNSCEYCIRSHTAAARKKGMSDKMLKSLSLEWQMKQIGWSSHIKLKLMIFLSNIN